MSDSIFNIPPIGAIRGFKNPDSSYTPKTRLLSNLVGTMMGIEDKNHDVLLTSCQLAELAYEKVAEKAELQLGLVFSSKEVAVEAMISEYNKRKLS